MRESLKELETVEYVVKRYLEELGKGTSYSDEELPNFLDKTLKENSRLTDEKYDELLKLLKEVNSTL